MKTYSIKTRSLIRALAVGPLAIIPTCIIIATISAPFLAFRQVDPALILETIKGLYLAALVYGFVGLFYSYGFTIFFGLPVYLLLRKLKLNQAHNVAVVSLFPAAFLFTRDTDAWEMWAIMGIFSMITGLACWFIAERLEYPDNPKKTD